MVLTTYVHLSCDYGPFPETCCSVISAEAVVGDVGRDRKEETAAQRGIPAYRVRAEENDTLHDGNHVAVPRRKR